MPTARSVVVMALIALLAFAAPATAQSGGVGTDGTITIDATDGPAVDVTTTDSEIVLDGPDGNNTVDVDVSEGSATFSSNSPTTAAVDAADLTGTYTRLTNIDTQGTNLSINPADKSKLTVGGAINTVEWRDGVADDNATDFTYDASGSASVTISTDQTNDQLVAVDPAVGTILDRTTINDSGTAVFSSLDSGSHDVKIKTTAAPQLTDPEPPDEGVTEKTPAEISVNVSDADFQDTNEEVTVTFYNANDSSVVGSETVTSPGRASVTWDSALTGANEWFANATDSNGLSTTTQTFSFETPDSLYIYNESQPNQLYDNGTEFDVRFIQEGEQEVIERSTTNGRVPLSGLPRGSEFIVTVRPSENSELVYRRIIVKELTERQEVYILPKNQANSEVKFDLDDPTGQFSPTQTKLFVEKPITKDFNDDGNDTTEYRVVGGDYFGASGQFPMIVQNGERYRLRVESNDVGGSRILGAYSTQSPEIVPIQIEEIAPSGNVDGGRVVYGGVEGEQVAVRYLDPTESTQSVEYRVVDDSGSEIVPNTTRNSQEFADFYDLPAGDNASYTVDYTITREDGTKSSGSFDAGRVVGGVSERLDTNPDILELVSYVLIIASMGLVVLVNAQLAPLTGTGVATLLTVFGLVAIPAPILGIAGAISVLLPIGRR